MNGTIVEKTFGLAQTGKLVGVSSLLVTGRLSHAPTIGYPLRKQSRLQTVPTLARSRGQGSMFNTPPLLGAAVDMGLCNGTGAQRGGIGLVAAGRPPAAEGTPHAASTVCNVCV